MAGGVLTIEGGVGAIGIIDGFGRAGAALHNLLSNNDVANNMGGIIGQALGGAEGRQYGTMIDDVAASIFTSGAVGSLEDAYHLIYTGNYATGSVELINGVSGLDAARSYFNQLGQGH